MYLCLTISGSVVSANPVSEVSSCSGYIAVSATEYSSQALTYPEVQELLGATLVLFVLAFLLRALRKQLGF